MIYIILQSILSAACLSVALCGLLTNKMKYRDYIIIFMLTFILAILALYYNIGQAMTIVVIGLELLIIVRAQKTHPIVNFCMACIGYMTDVFLNYIVLISVTNYLNITCAELEAKYYLQFSTMYFILESIVFYILRNILYKIIKIQKYFGKEGIIKYGVLIEFGGTVCLFVVNIIFGEKVGYNSSALIMNSILFGVCFVLNSIILFYCAKQIQADEKRKIDEAKFIMTQNYINGLECMISETRSIRHDYKNILSTMSGYLQEDDYVGLKDYFNANIRNFVIAADKQGQIWNSLAEINPIELKGFLYEKALKASSLQVDFRVITEQGTTLQYHDMENLIRVFGNLMDNAIEAAAESAEKLVDLRIANTQNGVSVIIRNSFAEKPDVSRMFQKGYTTKGDGHGEGLYYVKEYLDQHNDIECYFSIERNEFVESLKIMNM